MKRVSLKLWQRVLIVAVTSSLPLLLIAGWLINVSVSKDIRFTLQEERGVVFLGPLEKLLDLLPQYAAAARNVQFQDPGAAAAFDGLRGRIDQAMAAIQAEYQGEFGRQLRNPTPAGAGKDGEDQFAIAADHWRKLRQTPAAGVTVYAVGELVADVRIMIKQAGNASNLVLDNELDSYYLVDITLVTLPPTQERLGESILQTGVWLRRNEVASHLPQLAAMAALLRQAGQDRIIADAQTALTNESRSHRTGSSMQIHLPPVVQRFGQASQTYVNLLNGLVAGQTVSAEEVANAGRLVREESFHLWDACASELDGLLKARAAAYRRTEMLDFACIIGTILLTALAVWLVSVELDITDRRETEARLHRLKNHLANILDSMPAALVGLDAGGMVTHWNRAAETLTGLPEQSAIGRSVYVLLPEFAAAIRTLEEKTKGGGPASLEKLCLAAAGDRQFYDLMLYPLADDGIGGSELRIENVTERHNVQAMIVQTEKMMSLGGLAAGMAHEINNPLGIISQAAQNIERRLSPDLPANQKAAAEIGLPVDRMQGYLERREIPVFIRDIREASSRAARIIAGILQFSRKSGTERQPVSLAAVMNRTVELAGNDYDLRKQFDFRSIEIIRDFQPDLPAVPAVEVELQQVLLNLLKNAAQAMAHSPAGKKPQITLRVRREDKFAVMEVADNGPGMEERIITRIFEPFFTTKSPGVGTGLGLSVSYMIITQNHNGLINVESSPGNGARFIVKLPLAERNPS